MQSADRALAILASFDERRPELGVTELAAELGTHRSTASRLLATLERRGLVRRVGERFAPGPELARLGGLAARGADLVEMAQEPLERLAAETGETVNLAVREGDGALNVHQLQTAHLVGVTDWTGRSAPLHATANGKALLAFGAGELPAELTAHTQRTVISHRALVLELGRIRRRGYAIAVEELEQGLHAVAAPVFDASAQCVAAVSVSGPSFRLPKARLAAAGRACAGTAAEISSLLGGRGVR